MIGSAYIFVSIHDKLYGWLAKIDKNLRLKSLPSPPLPTKKAHIHMFNRSAYVDSTNSKRSGCNKTTNARHISRENRRSWLKPHMPNAITVTKGK